MYLEALIFLTALIFLVKGSDFFVKAASDLATRLGVSEFVVGLTIVALGTSIPELAASIATILDPTATQGLILGNILGSNIANIGLIIGVAATIASIKTDKRMLLLDSYVMLFAAGLFFLFAASGGINWVASTIFLLLYLAYIFFLLEEDPQTGETHYHFNKFFGYFLRFGYINTIQKTTLRAINNTGTNEQKALLLRDTTILLLSGAAVVLGAKYVVQSATYFAGVFGVGDTLIGITLLAVGTSVPELSVTIAAAKRGLGQIALGNVIGSNIANIFLVLGITGLLEPLKTQGTIITFIAPTMLLFTTAMVIFLRSDWRVRRREGIALLTLYALFILIIIAQPGLTT